MASYVFDEFSFCICSGVRYTRIGETVYLLHLDRDRYYALDGVGADVWAAIEHGQSIEQLIPGLASKYAADTEKVRVDVRRFVEELLAAGLLVPPPDEDRPVVQFSPQALNPKP